MCAGKYKDFRKVKTEIMCGEMVTTKREQSPNHETLDPILSTLSSFY